MANPDKSWQTLISLLINPGKPWQTLANPGKTFAEKKFAARLAYRLACLPVCLPAVCLPGWLTLRDLRFAAPHLD